MATKNMLPFEVQLLYHRLAACHKGSIIFYTVNHRKTQAGGDSLFTNSLPLPDPTFVLPPSQRRANAQVWKPTSDTNVPKLEEVSTFAGHFLGVVSMSASVDGRLCAVSSLDGKTTLQGTRARTPTHAFPRYRTMHHRRKKRGSCAHPEILPCDVCTWRSAASH